MSVDVHTFGRFTLEAWKNFTHICYESYIIGDVEIENGKVKISGYKNFPGYYIHDEPLESVHTFIHAFEAYCKQILKDPRFLTRYYGQYNKDLMIHGVRYEHVESHPGTSTTDSKIVVRNVKTGELFDVYESYFDTIERVYKE